MSNGAISARRQSGDSDCYSWVWVIPLSTGQFRVAAIEVPKCLVDEDVSFFEDDFRTPFLKIVETVDEVDAAVREAGVDPADLDAPWNNDFPL
jgi:hypothetical protein